MLRGQFHDRCNVIELTTGTTEAVDTQHLVWSYFVRYVYGIGRNARPHERTFGSSLTIVVKRGVRKAFETLVLGVARKILASVLSRPPLDNRRLGGRAIIHVEERGAWTDCANTYNNSFS